jgi:hypothetical protein
MPSPLATMAGPKPFAWSFEATQPSEIPRRRVQADAFGATKTRVLVVLVVFSRAVDPKIHSHPGGRWTEVQAQRVR